MIFIKKFQRQLNVEGNSGNAKSWVVRTEDVNMTLEIGSYWLIWDLDNHLDCFFQEVYKSADEMTNLLIEWTVDTIHILFLNPFVFSLYLGKSYVWFYYVWFLVALYNADVLCFLSFFLLFVCFFFNGYCVIFSAPLF